MQQLKHTTERTSTRSAVTCRLPFNAASNWLLRTLTLLAIVQLALPALATTSGNRGIQCDGEVVCREVATGLPFQVLPRSFSNVYTDKNADRSSIAVANIQPFAPLYVFQMDDIDYGLADAPQGWYRVSAQETGEVLGWMQASDVLEWRQPLIVAYTHPGTAGEGRQRVLMFESKQHIYSLLDDDDPTARVLSIYNKLENGIVDTGLISKEPERFVDISRDFYLLPIIDHERVEWNGDDVRILQLASALPDKRGADTLKDPDYLQESMQKPGAHGNQDMQALNIDLVFVMDMTRSMQPYIDKTRDAMQAIANRAWKSSLGDSIQFGLVGFRDATTVTPELEFTSRNFTPQLLDIDAFEQLLDTQVRASVKSSVGYAEEVFAGIDTAIGSNWNEDSLRFLVVVSDASSHPVGHPQNTSGKDARMLQLQADESQIHIIALHLLNARHPEDQSLARAQYRVLSSIRGNEDSAALVSVDTEDIAGFQEAVEAIGNDIAATVAQAQQGVFTDSSEDTTGDVKGDPTDAAVQARKAARAVINAAMMEYLGRDVDAPKDIVAWTIDRDLTNPLVTSLDVRVLLKKSQLNDLVLALDRVITALDQAQVNNQQFFTALQAVAGQTMKDPDELSNASTLAQSGMLPTFIESLPYRSEILHMTEAMFASMTAQQRADLDARLRAKLQAYRDVSSTVDGWKSLYEGDSDLSKVYPLRLEYLP